jgi:arylsulfatase A-like enzyme
MAITMDWTATILAAAETKAADDRPLDGIDLLSVLGGNSAPHDRTFFWRIYDQDAVRQGKWKYLRNGEKRYLFDLTADEREQANFRTKYPDLFQRLAGEFDRWNQQMLPRPSAAH